MVDQLRVPLSLLFAKLNSCNLTSTSAQDCISDDILKISQRFWTCSLRLYDRHLFQFNGATAVSECTRDSTELNLCNLDQSCLGFKSTVAYCSCVSRSRGTENVRLESAFCPDVNPSCKVCSVLLLPSSLGTDGKCMWKRLQ